MVARGSPAEVWALTSPIPPERVTGRPSQAGSAWRYIAMLAAQDVRRKPVKACLPRKESRLRWVCLVRQRP